MRVRRVSVSYMAVLVSCLFPGCSRRPQEPGRYYDWRKGFSIRFPEGWEERKPDFAIAVKRGNPDETAEIGVQVQKIASTQTLAAGFSHMKSYTRTGGGGVERDGETVIDGQDAYWFVAHVADRQMLYFLTKKDNYLYAIIVTADADTFTEDFEAEMTEVAESLRFE